MFGLWNLQKHPFPRLSRQCGERQHIHAATQVTQRLGVAPSLKLPRTQMFCEIRLSRSWMVGLGVRITIAMALQLLQHRLPVMVVAITGTAHPCRYRRLREIIDARTKHARCQQRQNQQVRHPHTERGKCPCACCCAHIILCTGGVCYAADDYRQSIGGFR